MEKSRILIIGGTGHIGKHIVTASVRLGHPTAVLTRDSAPSDPAKVQLIKSFADSGAAVIKVPVIISICYLVLRVIFFFPCLINNTMYKNNIKILLSSVDICLVILICS